MQVPSLDKPVAYQCNGEKFQRTEPADQLRAAKNSALVVTRAGDLEGDQYDRMIRAAEKLCNKLYGASDAPAKPKLKWCYVHFGLCDEAAGFFGAIARGPNRQTRWHCRSDFTFSSRHSSTGSHS